MLFLRLLHAHIFLLCHVETGVHGDIWQLVNLHLGFFLNHFRAVCIQSIFNSIQKNSVELADVLFLPDLGRLAEFVHNHSQHVLRVHILFVPTG